MTDDDPHYTDNENIEQALIDLLAIERDRQLGYREFHMDTKTALENAIEVLEANGHNIDDIVLPEDQEVLGLND